MSAIAEWTHRKVNPVDDASLFQQQLVEDLLIPKRYKFFCYYCLFSVSLTKAFLQITAKNHGQLLLRSYGVASCMARSLYRHGG